MKLEALTDKQQELVATHYDDALRIGNAFKSSVLHDDEKENFAVYGLMLAAQKWDEARAAQAHCSFNTFLYRVIWRTLIVHNKGVKDKQTNEYRPLKKVMCKNKIVYEHMLEEDGYSRFASLFPVYDRMNELEYNELLEAVRLRLGDKQRFLFEALIDPIGMGIEMKKTKRTFKVTVESLADVMGVSKQQVSQDLKKVRSVVERVMSAQDSRFFKLNPGRE